MFCMAYNRENMIFTFVCMHIIQLSALIYYGLAECTQCCLDGKKYRRRPMMTLIPTLFLLFTHPFFLPAADDPDPDHNRFTIKIDSLFNPNPYSLLN